MENWTAQVAVFILILLQPALAAHRTSLPIEPDLSFDTNYYVRWAPDHVTYSDNNKTVQLVLDQASGAGFGSKDKYLFGHFTMKIKLVPGESAGTVTSFYMSSETDNHDELDFEFLGNASGQPYIVQTNVFANGNGNREQRIYLWFDPTVDYHTYGLLWNPQQILFYVDDIPIRTFKNYKTIGGDYPLIQPMGIYSSLWNGDDWATRGGLEKIKWSSAPFIASYRGFNIDACKCTGDSVDACSNSTADWWRQAAYQVTSSMIFNRLKWVRRNYLTYDYCKDAPRFASTNMPLECSQKL